MKNSDSNARIRVLLETLELTQTEFCNRTGITKSALSNYLNGDRQPRQDQLDKIATAFDVNPSWLMGYDVEMRVNDPKVGEIVIEPQPKRRSLAHISKTVLYNTLLEAARGCTDEQIEIAINLLNQFKKTNTYIFTSKTPITAKDVSDQVAQIQKEKQGI